MNNQKKKIVQLKFPVKSQLNDFSQRSNSFQIDSLSSEASVPFISNYMAKNEHIMRFKMLNEDILQEPEIKSLRMTDAEDKDIQIETNESIEGKKTPTQRSNNDEYSLKLLHE